MRGEAIWRRALPLGINRDKQKHIKTGTKSHTLHTKHTLQNTQLAKTVSVPHAGMYDVQLAAAAVRSDLFLLCVRPYYMYLGTGSE